MLLAALVALVAGCAHPVMGKQWHTGLTIVGVGIAEDVVVEFTDPTTVRATVVNGRLNSCTTSQTKRIAGTWRVEGDRIWTFFDCSAPIVCDTGEVDACRIVQGSVGGYLEMTSAQTLQSVDHPMVHLGLR
ncbi:MAG: hypothetical protein U0269_37835 [Polyangiales bacterium]